jgi:hypothetical protein
MPAEAYARGGAGYGAPIVTLAAHADASVVVTGTSAYVVQVGVLASDAQHGVRGGGTQHAVVVASGAAGFMSGADKAKLDALPATVADVAAQYLVLAANATLTNERVFTPSTGLTAVDAGAGGAYTLTADLVTGKAGGLTATGGTGSGENLTLRSTSHATKGKVRFGAAGTSYFDEAAEAFTVTVAADPRVAGLARPIGTIVVDGSGIAYQKVGAGDTHWQRLGFDTQSVAGAAATSVTFSGLNGDLDGGYEIEGSWKGASGTPAMTLQPNAITANQLGSRVTIDTGGAVPSARTDLLLQFMVGTNNNNFKATFTSRTGRSRHLMSFGRWRNSATELEICTGEWSDTTTNITSLKLNCSVASGIDIGAVFTLRRLGNPLL